MHFRKYLLHATGSFAERENKRDRLYLPGRFAEWEYYNMDEAMGADNNLSKRFFKDGKDTADFCYHTCL